MIKGTIILSEGLAVGPQLDEESIKELARKGYKSVVNLSTPKEYNQKLNPADEEGLVQAEGMAYINIPISLARMKPSETLKLCKEIEQLETPTYVHCNAGQRATPVGIITYAIEKGLNSKQAIKEAKEAGLTWRAPCITSLVEHSLHNFQVEDS